MVRSQTRHTDNRAHTSANDVVAGADIKEQRELDFVGAYNSDYLKNLNDGVASTHKPIIGAINGYAVRRTSWFRVSATGNVNDSTIRSSPSVRRRL